MRLDSVFSPLLETPFPDDRPLIPLTEIEQALDTIEQSSVDRQSAILLQQTDLLLRQATPHLQARDVAAIAALNWNAATALQTPIFSVWQLGWQVGSAHMIREMRSAVPLPHPPAKKFSSPTSPLRFATPEELALIAALFNLEPDQTINTAAEQAVLRRVNHLAGNFANDLLAWLRLDLIAAISPDIDGKVISRKELEQRIQTGLGVGRDRAEMISRTELTEAYNTSRVQTALQSDLVTHFRFLAISDRRTTPICSSRNGMLIPVTDQGAIAANKPALHVRCVIGSTRITSSSPIRRVANRFANTDVLIIRTASDRELTCTPNHPILTDQGWVAAESVNLGDKVVCSNSREWEVGCDRHNQDIPPTIQEVAESFFHKPSVITVPVPVSAPDFHGDGASSQVAVISTDTGLVSDLNPSISQELSKIKLVLADLVSRLLSGQRPLDLFLPSVNPLPSNSVGSSSQPPPLLDRGYIHPGLLLLTPIPQRNTCLLQPFLDRARAALQGLRNSANPNSRLKQSNNLTIINPNPLRGSTPDWTFPGNQAIPQSFRIESQALSKVVDRLAGQIGADNLVSLFRAELMLQGLGGDLYSRLFQAAANHSIADPKLLTDMPEGSAGSVFLDKVIEIKRERFSGHLYNLETEAGYYSANGIITSNCRSTLSPVMAGINPTHQDWAGDPARSLGNRDLAPLPKGWG